MNAQYKKNGRVLHHGTLLFDSPLESLKQALTPPRIKLESRGIQSVISRVTTIKKHLYEPMTVSAFREGIYHHIRQTQSDMKPYHLTEADISGIEALIQSKYGTFQWNYGQSPSCGFERSLRTSGGVMEAHLDVEKGVIKKVRFTGDFFGEREIEEIYPLLIGIEPTRAAMYPQLIHVPLQTFCLGTTLDEWLALLCIE